nr:hypothetical protein [Bradyrhizobium brasilense]
MSRPNASADRRRELGRGERSCSMPPMTWWSVAIRSAMPRATASRAPTMRP